MVLESNENYVVVNRYSLGKNLEEKIFNQKKNLEEKRKYISYLSHLPLECFSQVHSRDSH